MIINTIELILLGVALGVSKNKMTPLFLVVFNLFVQYLNYSNGLRLDEIAQGVDLGRYTLEFEDFNIMVTYLFNGATIAIFGFGALLLTTKMSYLTAAVVFIQAILNFVTGLAVYEISQGNDFYHVIDLHSQLGDKFVIVYVLIAWICVYLSKDRAS